MNYSKKSTSRKQKALKGKGTKMGKKLGVVFMKTLLVLIIALGVAGLCGGIGIIKGVMENAPDITSASVLPRGYKSVVYDADGNKTAELVAEGTNRTYVKLDNIPKHVQEAFIAIEDERFYDHNGIDIQGMVRAGVKFVVSGFRTTQGASTITQQLLKNNVFDFMSEDGMLDKIERKLQEQYLAIELEKIMTKEEILNKIATLTGGRAAEELIFHSITTGASNDIEQATKMARALITRYGMTEDFDMVALETVNNAYLGGDTSLACSEQTASRVDAKVVEIVQEQHKKAYKLLADNRRKLDEIAQYLYEKETISGEEFMRILNAQPQLPAATPADSTNNSL